MKAETTMERSIIRKVGKDGLRDVCRGGADGGFNGFIYYTDTIRFFRKHRSEIQDIAESMAQDMGENVLDMIKGFWCLNGDYSTAEVARVLYGPWKDGDEYTAIANALAWFALEETARKFNPDL